MFGPGSAFFEVGTTPPATPPTVTAANNGLSLSGTTVQLGGPLLSAVPATLLNNREIPSAGFTLAFSGSGKLLVGNNAVDPTTNQLQVNNGISITNGITMNFSSNSNAGNYLQFFFGSSNVSIAAMTTNFSTFFGHGAGGVGPNNPQSCCAFGYNTLSSTTITATNNSNAFGINVLAGQTSGQWNDGFGTNAGFKITTGSLNFFGGGSNGFNFTTQSQNTLVGELCCVSPGVATNLHGATAQNSTFLGYNAGGSGITFTGVTTTYTNCIVIGSQSGVSTEGTTLSGTTIIGNGLLTNVNNVLMLGTSSQNTQVGFPNNTADSGDRLQVNGNISGTQAIRLGIRTITANDTFGATDFGIIANTASGNISINITPATIGKAFGYIKKLSTDANTVTLTATAGSIYDDAGAVTSLVWSGSGESKMFQSDGTNIYII